MDNLNSEQLLAIAQQYALPIVWAILILIFGRIVAGISRNLIKRLLKKANLDVTLVKFAGSLVYVSVFIFTIVAALESIGVNTTSFAAVLAAAGLAIGLALQGSLSNFASGIMLIVLRPFKVDDYVEAGGVEGSVEEVHIFTTHLRTPDNKRVIVPNGQITGGSIINYSAKETRRIDLVIGVSYSDDLKKVRSILLDVLNSEPRILREPEITIGLLEMADSSINFAVRPWVNTPDYWPVKFEIQERIKERFDREGISIPFPQRDVHLFQENKKAV
ncbi:MAG: mechanosensitive ion channel [Calditrichaeota bacterium]|nr:mechanosensitive ion channel [Calditrichota bacterium]